MTLLSQALQAQQSGRIKEAEVLYRQVVASEPMNFDALHMLGVISSESHRYEEAEKFFYVALSVDQSFPPCFFNFGAHFVRRKDYQSAIEQFDKALQLAPGFAPAHSDRGLALSELGRYDEALTSLNKAIAIAAKVPSFWSNRGNVFYIKRMFDSALRDYDQAISISVNYADAWLGRANALRELGRYDEALSAYDRALSLNSKPIEVWRGRASIFADLHRYDQTVFALSKILEIDPEAPFIKGSLLHHRMLCCDWKAIDRSIAEIDKDITSGKLSVDPFGWQAITNSKRSLQLCAELYAKENYQIKTDRPVYHSPNLNRKVRVGYLSGELREQATAFLIVGVFEHHDPSQFEVYAFDNGWNDQSVTRRRINAAVKDIIDISRLSDVSAADAIRENQIDILVNLNGYFGKHRMSVFARRPAPIQVNYLGFPGTLGASYVDYIVADQYVIPASEMSFYSEKVAYLPNCYQPNDRKKEIGNRDFNRAECGLPPSSFVFTCFNNPYKILPDQFSRWMRILGRVDDSVLWLLEENVTAVSNLRNEAQARGIDPERLIFAKRMRLPEHLARHRLADLFLDTLPYNAHTTASDALWAGLPVLTQTGETFPGRVATSLLNAIGLPELITETPEAYENLAIELASDREKLCAVKAKLAAKRLTTPLFDTQCYTEDLETAYLAMFERYQTGLAPASISVRSIKNAVSVNE